jgi:hypothetical protein
MYRPPTEPLPKLNPNELYERRIRRDQSRLRTYNQVLEQIHARIYSASQLQNHPAYIMYTVPPFIFGLPKLDLEDLIVYLVYMLRQSGFEVRFTYPNLLYISWKHHEKEYLLHQNPIIQAMLPPEPKRGGRKGGAGGGASVSFNLPGPIAQQVAPAPRKLASEYQPPSSFVQTMERPTTDKSKSVLDDLWMFS